MIKSANVLLGRRKSSTAGVTNLAYCSITPATALCRGLVECAEPVGRPIYRSTKAESFDDAFFDNCGFLEIARTGPEQTLRPSVSESSFKWVLPDRASWLVVDLLQEKMRTDAKRGSFKQSTKLEQRMSRDHVTQDMRNLRPQTCWLGPPICASPALNEKANGIKGATNKQSEALSTNIFMMNMFHTRCSCWWMTRIDSIVITSAAFSLQLVGERLNHAKDELSKSKYQKHFRLLVRDLTVQKPP
jgi:hypothetical protein